MAPSIAERNTPLNDSQLQTENPSNSPTPPARSLGHLAHHSAFALLGSNFVVVAVGLIQQVALGRILDPRVFGLIALCLLVTTFASVVSETGFLLALIHRGTIESRELNTYWTVSVLRGMILTAVISMLAGPIGSVFHETNVVGPLRVLSITFLIDGLASPKLVLLRRDLRYGSIAYQQAISSLVGLSVSVTLAVMTHSVWALVAGYLSMSVVRLVASYVIQPCRPHFQLSRDLLRELSGFGRWVTIGNILLYFLNSGDNLVVSRMLGTQPLGFYQQAFMIANMPATNITAVVSQVAFPAFTKLRGTDGLGRAYIRVLRSVIFFSAPLSVGLLVLAPDAVPVVLGSKWIPMIATLQILSVWGFIRSISANSGPVFNAVGRPQVITQQAAIRLCMFAAIVIPFTNWMGISGTALAVIVGGIPAELLVYVRTIRASRCRYQDFLTAVFVPLASAAFMAVVMLLIGRQVNQDPSLWWLALQVGIGTLAYLAFTLGIQMFTSYPAAAPVWEPLQAIKFRTLAHV